MSKMARRTKRPRLAVFVVVYIDIGRISVHQVRLTLALREDVVGGRFRH